MTDYAYADLVGESVTIRTTGSVTIDGTLQEPRPDHPDVHVVDVSGVILLLPETSTTAITRPEAQQGPGSVDGRHHVLADCQDQVGDTDDRDARAVHEAAHAVVGELVGLRVKEVTLADTRTTSVGGGVAFATAGDVQATAVQLMAGPLAHAKRLADLGYDQLTQAAVEGLCGQEDHRKVFSYLRDGWIVWQGQAWRDAEKLLAAPKVWEAILRVADLLSHQGRLTGWQVQVTLGPHYHLAAPPVWMPDLAALDRLRAELRAQGQGEPLVEEAGEGSRG